MKLLLLVGLAAIGFSQIRNRQRWVLVGALTVIAGVSTLLIG